jgi:hypothetical protein
VLSDIRGSVWNWFLCKAEVVDAMQSDCQGVAKKQAHNIMTSAGITIKTCIMYSVAFAHASAHTQPLPTLVSNTSCSTVLAIVSSPWQAICTLCCCPCTAVDLCTVARLHQVASQGSRPPASARCKRLGGTTLTQRPARCAFDARQSR